MSTGLSVIEPQQYPILAGDTNVGEVIEANLGGEEISEFDLPRILVPSGSSAAVFAVPNPAGEEGAEKFITGIVMHIGKRRSYYRSKEVDGSRPDCESHDMVNGTGDPGGVCAACPLNKFGSATMQDGSEGAGKACKESRLLFVVRPGEWMPIVVKAPSGSLRSVKKWLGSLKLPYFQTVTQIGLRKEKNRAGTDYYELTFQQVGVVPGDVLDHIKGYREGITRVFA